MIYSATKIIATLGPATSSEKAITALLKAGVNIFRLNFSHGDFETHGKMIEVIRRTSARLGVSAGIMQDLPGPKIRLGLIPGNALVLKRGDEIVLTSDKESAPGEIPVQYSGFHRDVKPGVPVYINDGAIRLRVLKINDGSVKCRVEIGGMLSSHKGINLPGTKISVPSLTAYDRKCLKFGIKHGVDFVAMSFVRAAGDLRLLRKAIRANGGNQFIVAKIEKKEAIEDFDNILEETDAIMIARGDMGIELPIYEVPLRQKELITRCNRAGIPVITATQVLESMTNSPRPTRAEATDAANAVIDGTDALMLSGETAVGNFPVEAVETLKAICAETEKSIPSPPEFRMRREDNPGVAACVARSVCQSASALDVKVIATPTRSGHTARLVSRFRPKAKIIAFSESDCTRAHLLLSRGVVALPIDQKLPFADLLVRMRGQLLKNKLIRRGETIIITAGSPHSRAGETNLMVIETV